MRSPVRFEARTSFRDLAAAGLARGLTSVPSTGGPLCTALSRTAPLKPSSQALGNRSTRDH